MGDSLRMRRGHVCQLHLQAILIILLSAGISAMDPQEDSGEPRKKYVLNILVHLGSYLKDRISSMNLSEKRGIDFGLGRGYSGSQAARHMLGLQQVNYAGGPGRRKRSPGSNLSNILIAALPITEQD